jgi:hypothetical protein
MFYLVMNRKLLFTIVLLTIFKTAISGEGMWLPLLIDSLNIVDMKNKGFQLTAEDIYSLTQPSLKDAVVLFGNGCTGELISPDGLVITNHHCGYSRIQSHSTVDNNYLTNGFWAASQEEELPNPGLTVTFLIRMENITDLVLAGVPDTVAEGMRNRMVRENAGRIIRMATSGTHYDAEVKSFFFGKEYYLFVYEIFKDVRLVGAPPESIGRFGGDTDNWIWPRHTGDFSLFRIYSDKENKPAVYSPDNIPYKPRKYFPVSLEGVKEGDFTMVMGYPGHTDEYLTSEAMALLAEKLLPAKIAMRAVRLKALEQEMQKSPELRLRYTGRYVSISNSWKKWIGVTTGVIHASAIEKREHEEKDFERWARLSRIKNTDYSNLLTEIRDAYRLYESPFLAYDLGEELLSSIDIFGLMELFQKTLYTYQDSSEMSIRKALQRLENQAARYFSDNSLLMDKQVLPELLKIYMQNVSGDYYPGFLYTTILKFKGNTGDYVDHLFRTSAFTDSLRFKRLMNRSFSHIEKVFLEDPACRMYAGFNEMLTSRAFPLADSIRLELNSHYRSYLTARMQMDTLRHFYPDANFTMRVAYGRVEGYHPSDAVCYRYYTTLDGILEKEDPEISDYQVPQKLKALQASKDYGPYNTDDQLPVCFIASNHTSGGNSGSPVINARGALIGINFDRNWEGTVSDYMYDPDICRNICLDIRYVLFIIDKFAGAKWLLDEFTLIRPD